MEIPGGKEGDTQCADSENQLEFSVMSQDVLEGNSFTDTASCQYYTGVLGFLIF